MRSSLTRVSRINEGGNVFTGTDRIKREHIKPTLLQFFKEFSRIFPKAEPHFKFIKTLGSVGKKDYSGDIDLALDEKSLDSLEDWGISQEEINNLFITFKKRARSASDASLLKKAFIVAVAEKIETSNSDIQADTKGSSAGALFLNAPQFNEQGEFLGKHVQVDINIGNVDWLSFAYYSNTYQGNVKGLHRTQLMLAMFANKGYTFSHNYGVKSKESNEVVASTPEQALNILNKEYSIDLTQEELSDYFDLIETIREDLPEFEQKAIFDRYLKILDSTRADIPEDLQEYWKENQERLGLTGKFLPDDSKLVPYKK